MNASVRPLRGGNLDIDLCSHGAVDWEQSDCPWNRAEAAQTHRCAVKGTSICKYFCGVKYLDSVLCSYPYENIDILAAEEIDREIKR